MVHNIENKPFFIFSVEFHAASFASQIPQQSRIMHMIFLPRRAFNEITVRI